MDIMELGAIGELVGGVAVIATLIYLAMQIHQGTNAVRASNHDVMLAALRSTRHAISRDPSLAELVIRGEVSLNDLSGVDRRRFEEFATSQFEIWEQAFVNRERRTIDQVLWDGWDGFARDKLATEGHRTIWRETRLQFHVPFRDYVEDEVLTD